MWQRVLCLIAALNMSVLLCGCSSDKGDQRGPDPQGTEASTAGNAGTDGTSERRGSAMKESKRPETKRGTIAIEGKEEPFRFRLFDSSRSALPVPFTTYVPHDIHVETASSGEGDAVRFIANFAGKRNDDAHLQAFFYAAGTNDAQARARVKEAAASRGLMERRTDVLNRYKWSLAEYDFSHRKDESSWIVGNIALGQHGDRFFHIMVHYPERYVEGFTPRADRILEEWRWEDTGEGL